MNGAQCIYGKKRCRFLHSDEIGVRQGWLVLAIPCEDVIVPTWQEEEECPVAKGFVSFDVSSPKTRLPVFTRIAP
jgi:hypothetical protein